MPHLIFLFIIQLNPYSIHAILFEKEITRRYKMLWRKMAYFGTIINLKDCDSSWVYCNLIKNYIFAISFNTLLEMGISYRFHIFQILIDKTYILNN